MKGADEGRRPAVVRTTLEALYVLAHFLAPVIPIAANEIFKKLGADPVPVTALSEGLYNLTPGTQVTVGDILFTKIDTEGKGQEAGSGSGLISIPMAEAAQRTSGEGKKTKDHGESSAAPGKKTNSTKKTSGPPIDQNKPEENSSADQLDFSKIELRVGEIKRVWNHENADRWSERE